MQRRHSLKERLEWIVCDASGTPIAAFADFDEANKYWDEGGYVFHHDTLPPDVAVVSGDNGVVTDPALERDPENGAGQE